MAMMEHLPPQDPIEVYQPQINQNYNNAKAYFNARKNAVRDFYLKELNIAIDIVMDNMNSTIIDEWEEEVIAAIQEAAASGLIGGNGGTMTGGSYKYQTSIDNILEMMGNGKGMSAAIQAEFKSFVANHVLGEKLKSMVRSDVASAAGVVLGEAKSGHWSSNTASDFVVTLDIDSPFDKVGNYYVTKRRMRTNISLSNFDESSVLESNALKKYLMNGAHGYYINHDISATSGGVRFIGARGGLSEVTESFNRRDSHGLRHTWEPDYAKVYARWVISKELINIIGPFNVALASGTGVQWFDDFLDKVTFDAEVSIGAIYSSSRNGRPTRETFPALASAYITIGDAGKILQRQEGKENVTFEVDLY